MGRMQMLVLEAIIGLFLLVRGKIGSAEGPLVRTLGVLLLLPMAIGFVSGN